MSAIDPFHGKPHSSSSAQPSKTIKTIVWSDVDSVWLFSSNRAKSSPNAPGKTDRDPINWSVPNSLVALEALVPEHYYLTRMRMQDAKSSNQAAGGGEYNMSRHELREKTLEKNGMEIRSIITPADPAYNAGLGAAYECFILPHETYAHINKADATLDNKQQKDSLCFDYYVTKSVHTENPMTILARSQKQEEFEGLKQILKAFYVGLRIIPGSLKIQYAMYAENNHGDLELVEGEVDLPSDCKIEDKQPISDALWGLIKQDIETKGFHLDISKQFLPPQYMGGLLSNSLADIQNPRGRGGLQKAVMAYYALSLLKDEGLPDELNLCFIDDELHNIEAVKEVVFLFQKENPKCKMNIQLVHYDKDKADKLLNDPNQNQPVPRKMGQERLDLIAKPKNTFSKVKFKPDFLALCYHLDPGALFKLAQIIVAEDKPSAYYLALLAQSVVKTEAGKDRIGRFIEEKGLRSMKQEACKLFSKMGIPDGIRSVNSAQELYEKYHRENLFNSVITDISVNAVKHYFVQKDIDGCSAEIMVENQLVSPGQPIFSEGKKKEKEQEKEQEDPEVVLLERLLRDVRGENPYNKINGYVGLADCAMRGTGKQCKDFSAASYYLEEALRVYEELPNGDKKQCFKELLDITLGNLHKKKEAEEKADTASLSSFFKPEPKPREAAADLDIEDAEQCRL